MTNAEKTQLLGFTPDELGAYFKTMGQPAFRAKQVFSWLHQGVPFEKMSNLPKALREQLDETCIANPVAVLETIESKLDGTIKLLYRLTDGNVIEGVLMRYKYGNTLCLSTQVGCRMGCAFCASTLDGCARSLTPAEMLGQIVCANGVLAPQEQKVGNIVLMGSGEPLDNYDNVVKFLRILRMEGGLCIGMRSVSLSTCGLVENMRRFAEEDLPVTLSLSLHAPNDELRSQLMPINRAYPLEELMDAIAFYCSSNNRRLTFEYILLRGVNDRPEHVRQLAKLLRGLNAYVNLIPYNAVDEKGFQGVDHDTAMVFYDALMKAGIRCTIRKEHGGDIDAACGQLRVKHLRQAKG